MAHCWCSCAIGLYVQLTDKNTFLHLEEVDRESTGWAISPAQMTGWSGADELTCCEATLLASLLLLLWS